MRQVNVDWFIDLVANGCPVNVKSVNWHLLCMSGRVAMCPVPDQARAGSRDPCRGGVIGRASLGSQEPDCVCR